MVKQVLLAGLAVNLLLTACGTPRQEPVPPTVIASQPVVVASPPPPEPARKAPEALPTPAPTEDSAKVQALVKKWTESGFAASAQYRTRDNQLEWITLRANLPSQSQAADEIVWGVAYFAKQAKQPLQLLLVTHKHQEDLRLSKIIKEAAQKSGGQNTIKFDHLIEPRGQRFIRLQRREVK